MLWGVDRATFRTIVFASSAARRERFEEALETIPLFNALTAEQRTSVAVRPASGHGGACATYSARGSASANRDATRAASAHAAPQFQTDSSMGTSARCLVPP